MENYINADALQLFTESSVHILENATNVRYTHTINDTYKLDFDIPANDNKARFINPYKTVVYCGQNNQLYKVWEINKNKDNTAIISVTALSLYHADQQIHVVRILDNAMGVSAIEQFRTIFTDPAWDDNPFTVLSNTQIQALGMTPLTRLIDFWEISKINPDDAVKKIIESAGYGEIYIDNYNVALVEQIGSPKMSSRR
ncbi:hypothetical protein AGMMS49975_15100 [Clostridia bacterium]|nr:hypothetical protein AGMMS49975_15100 [Clostridia bacterium]